LLVASGGATSGDESPWPVWLYSASQLIDSVTEIYQVLSSLRSIPSSA